VGARLAATALRHAAGLNDARLALGEHTTGAGRLLAAGAVVAGVVVDTVALHVAVASGDGAGLSGTKRCPRTGR